MRLRTFIAIASGALLCLGFASDIGKPSGPIQEARSFAVQGMVKEVSAGDARVVIQHEEIPGYMPAMTMPFRVKSPADAQRLKPGQIVSFRLRVTDTESWIEDIVIAETPSMSMAITTEATPPAPPANSNHPLKSFRFTDERGRAVSLDDFRGQALAITFFFTRCPIPEYCPRLSRNFQTASQKLLSLPNAPTNWHFISVSFDTQFDTPAVLKSYGEGYHYDPRHWSFWTGPADKIRELASLSDVQFESEGILFAHNFRTLVIGTTGKLQTSFPVGGDLSDSLVAEILKAATAPKQ